MDTIRTRATFTRWLLAIAAAVSAVAAITHVQEYRDPFRESDFADMVASLELLPFLATAILFISWLHGAYSRLPEVRSPQRFKPWWAIVAWFVPILNLFRPKQIADEVWKAANKPTIVVPGFVHVWWGAFIATGLLSNIAARFYASADTIGELRVAIAMFVVGDVLTVVAALLARRFVEDATSGLERNAAAAAA